MTGKILIGFGIVIMLSGAAAFSLQADPVLAGRIGASTPFWAFLSGVAVSLLGAVVCDRQQRRALTAPEPPGMWSARR